MQIALRNFGRAQKGWDSQLFSPRTVDCPEGSLAKKETLSKTGALRIARRTSLDTSVVERLIATVPLSAFAAPQQNLSTSQTASLV